VIWFGGLRCWQSRVVGCRLAVLGELLTRSHVVMRSSEFICRLCDGIARGWNILVTLLLCKNCTLQIHRRRQGIKHCKITCVIQGLLWVVWWLWSSRIGFDCFFYGCSLYILTVTVVFFFLIFFYFSRYIDFVMVHLPRKAKTTNNETERVVLCDCKNQVWLPLL